MKNTEKFLFYYSIVTTTVFLITMGVFEPKPFNLIIGILMLPISCYFWIRMTSPQAIGPELWSLRMVIVIIILLALGIGTKYIATNIDTSQLKSKTITEKVTPTQHAPSPSPTPSEISVNSDETITDVIYGTPIPIPTSFITTNSKSSVNVYEAESVSSTVIAQLKSGQIYPYSNKSKNWYKVYISDSVSGWVQSLMVKELK